MHTVLIVVAVLFVLAVIVFGYKKVVGTIEADASKLKTDASNDVKKL